MKPQELLDTCLTAIDRFNAGEVFADQPFVMLVLPRNQRSVGRTIKLFGRSGPVGDVATAKPRADGGLDVVAYFKAVAVVKALADMVGVKVNVRRKA